MENLYTDTALYNELDAVFSQIQESIKKAKEDISVIREVLAESEMISGENIVE